MSTFLGIPIVYPLTIESEIQRRSTRTANFRRITSVSGAQQWHLTLTLARDKAGARRAAAKLQAHRTAHDDGRPFTIPMPQHKGIVVPANQVNTVGAVAAGAAALNIRNASAGKQTIQAGTFFSLPVDTKVYQVSEDVNLDGVAQAAMKFIARLRVSQSTGVALDFAPDIRVRYTPGAAPYTYSAGRVFRAVLQLEEAL